MFDVFSELQFSVTLSAIDHLPSISEGLVKLLVIDSLTTFQSRAPWTSTPSKSWPSKKSHAAPLDTFSRALQLLTKLASLYSLTCLVISSGQEKGGGPRILGSEGCVLFGREIRIKSMTFPYKIDPIAGFQILPPPNQTSGTPNKTQ